MIQKLPRQIALLVGVCLGLAACTGSTVETPLATTTEATAPEAPATTEEVAGTATTTEQLATAPTPPESMPGDIIGFGPQRGDEIAVVGVEADDTLNVRIAPGTEFEVIQMLTPDADDLIAGGENRLLEDSFWVEIEVGDGFGWVNEAYVGFLGVSQSLESDLTVETSDPADVGAAIAEEYASDDVPLRVTLQAVDGDTVIYDVLGLPDDAAKGFRLTIVTQAADDERLGIASITEQTICSRGVTPEKLCV